MKNMSPHSAALSDYFIHNISADLYIETSYGTKEPMPIDVFFRSPNQFSAIESYALNLCSGKVLDIGAGVGSFSLALIEKKIDCTALEIEEELVNIMIRRGVLSTITENIFNLQQGNYDTLLLLMNGIGLVGDLVGLETFLTLAPKLMPVHGQLIFDSSDIAYLYEGELKFPANKYYGEISYRYCYEDQIGDWFGWLYIDPDLLKQIAKKHGWQMQVVMMDETEQYLARLFR